MDDFTVIWKQWAKCLDATRVNAIAEPKIKTKTSSGYMSPFEEDYQQIVSRYSFRRLQDKTQVFALNENDFIRNRLTHSLEVSSIAKQIGYLAYKNFKIFQLPQFAHFEEYEDLRLTINRDTIYDEKDRPFIDNIKNDQSRQYAENVIGEEKLIDYHDIMSLLSCAGLLHDIGNPPFGHKGEDAISRWFKEHLEAEEGLTYMLDGKKENIKQLLKDYCPTYVSDLETFEGNAQAIRLLLMPRSRFNVTKALAATLIKYPNRSDDPLVRAYKKDKSLPVYRHKIGYYTSEARQVEDILETMGLEKQLNDQEKAYTPKQTGFVRHPLCYILEAADDIAYITGDLEDAIKKMIMPSRKKVDLHLFLDEFGKYIEKQKETMDKESNDAKALEYTENLYTLLKSDLQEGLINENDILDNWIFTVREKLIESTALVFAKNFVAILDGTYSAELLRDQFSYQRFTYAFLKDFPVDRVFKTLSMQDDIGDAILEGYLDILVSCMMYYDSVEKRVIYPENYDNRTIDEIHASYVVKNFISKSVLDSYDAMAKQTDENDQLTDREKETVKLYARLRAVVDEISGMTDKYARNTYPELLQALTLDLSM